MNKKDKRDQRRIKIIAKERQALDIGKFILAIMGVAEAQASNREPADESTDMPGANPQTSEPNQVHQLSRPSKTSRKEVA